MLGRWSMLARRYYHHVVHGGTLKDHNVSYMVKGLETLEAKVIELQDELKTVRTKERERAGELAAQFVHNRLYKPDFPACSYHSREIKQLILTHEEEKTDG
jgi:hypothetical protein